MRYFSDNWINRIPSHQITVYHQLTFRWLIRAHITHLLLIRCHFHGSCLRDIHLPGPGPNETHLGTYHDPDVIPHSLRKGLILRRRRDNGYAPQLNLSTLLWALISTNMLRWCTLWGCAVRVCTFRLRFAISHKHTPTHVLRECDMHFFFINCFDDQLIVIQT